MITKFYRQSEYTNSYLLREIPGKILEKCQMSKRDKGVDGMCVLANETREKEKILVPFQVKFKTNQSKICYTYIHSFLYQVTHPKRQEHFML